MAYKVFQNGYPLPASELNNYLMNQTVMVFATASARAADIPSPTEGMVTYREDANVLEVYNGSAWTDINDNTAAIPKSIIDAAGDLIIGASADTPARLAVGGAGALLKSDGTSPAWLSAGTAGYVLTSTGSDAVWQSTTSGGMDLISTTTMSGSAVNLTSIPNTYKDLRVVFRNFKSTSTSDISATMRVNNTASIYADVTDSTTTAGGVTANSSSFGLGPATVEGSAASTSTYVVDFYDYANTSTVKLIFSQFAINNSNTSGNFSFGTRAGIANTTSAISELNFTNTSAQGTILLYGVK